MIKDSMKKPYEFKNKYFTPLFMDNAIETLFDKDVEILYTACPVSSSVFFYCDDLTEEELLKVYDYMQVNPKIHAIPVLMESDFDSVNSDNDKFWNLLRKVMSNNSKLFRVISD